jgi:hypothetical protein
MLHAGSKVIKLSLPLNPLELILGEGYFTVHESCEQNVADIGVHI